MSWFLALRTLFGAKNLVEAKVQNEKCLRESRREFDYHGIKIVETYDSKGHRYFNDEESRLGTLMVVMAILKIGML